MVTVSRGVRLPESRFMRIYEIWREARVSHTIQINDVFNALLELGLTTFAHLPNHMKHGLFSCRTAQEDLKLHAALEPKIKRVAGQFRSDDKLDLRLPRPVKEIIRSEAQAMHASMSAVARRRLIDQGATA